MDDQEAAFEVVDVERGGGFPYAARVLVEPGGELGALAYRVLGGLVVRIGLADVDRVIPALQRRVGWEVAAVVDGVHAGAVEFRDSGQRVLGLRHQRQRHDAAGRVRVGGVEDGSRAEDWIQLGGDVAQLRGYLL